MVYNIVLKVTHACNLACRYCYSVADGSRTLSEEDLGALIRSAVRLDADTVNFIWHGGEPLLAGLEYFQRAVALQEATREGTGKRFVNSLQTNGTLVSRELAEFFKSSGFAVGVSLDGPPGHHDRGRPFASGLGSYARALAGYDLLREHEVSVGLVCVVDPTEPPAAEELLDWLEAISADSVSLNPLFAGRTAPSSAYGEFLVSLQRALAARRSPVRVRELLLAGTTADDRMRMGLHDACHPGWPCWETISTVDENGYIYFACDRFLDSDLGERSRYRLGHVRNGGFREAHRSPAFLRAAALAGRQKRECAYKCSLYSTCDGGCVADWMLAAPEVAAARPGLAFCDGVRAVTGSTNSSAGREK